MQNDEVTRIDRIREMFDRIASVYDSGNDFLSFGFARLWRRNAVGRMKTPGRVLDVACGTGDLAWAAACRFPDAEVVGIDFSKEMIARARVKYPLEFLVGDVQALPFAPAAFDAVTVGFGFRNFQDKPKALAELNRMLRNGGQLLILEASRPESISERLAYRFFRRTFVRLAVWISGHADAYAYLTDSMLEMPPAAVVHEMLDAAGFTNIQRIRYGFGLCSLYIGEKA